MPLLLTYVNREERKAHLVAHSDKVMLHDDYDADWKHGDEIHGVLTLALPGEIAARVVTADEIDSNTEAAINIKIHPTAPLGEQIGILRSQIVQMLNGDMSASEEFTRLNEIAATEIEKSAAEKAVL